jgi:hypothetical protein
MRKWRWGAGLLALLLILTACGYGPVVKKETPGPELKSPDPGQYGTLKITWVRESRSPRGLSRFPDGGKPRDVAWYAIVHQVGLSGQREVKRIDLQPVRSGDYGDLIDFHTEWPAANRMIYRIRNGYLAPSVKTTEGEVQLQPLP